MYSLALPKPLFAPKSSWSAIATTAAAALNSHICHRPLQCMEIWGGSHAAESCVETPGIDAWVYSRPYAGDKDGGDVHYVSLCGGGYITRFILADVAGHGAKVADLANSLRDLMRHNINRRSHSRLVVALNREFMSLNAEGRFATALVVTYLARRKTLTITNAGHPPPLMYRAGQEQWSWLPQHGASQAANLPLGVDDRQQLAHAEVTLQPGDFLLLYTDGLLEMTNSDQQALGTEALLSIVESLDATHPETMAATLKYLLDDFRAGQPLSDDLTFLLLHHTASKPPRQSWRQRLDVYAKVFGIKPV